MNDLIHKTPKILVIGDLIVDKYLWGTSKRISAEAPVPIVSITSESTILGGAGNVINNLKSLGTKVDVISVIGDCAVSLELKKLLESIQINTQNLIFESQRICSKKTRIIAANQQVVRYDQESTEEITKPSQSAILSNLKKRISNYDCILLSDYGKGVLTPELTQNIISFANNNDVKVIIDPKGLDYKKYTGAYLLTPNLKEAGEAMQTEINSDESLERTIKEIKFKYQLEISLITLSDNGIAIFDDRMRKYPTQAQEVFDVTGAGDTVIAALGFAISCDMDIDKAVEFANLAAGVVVGKIGSATATLNEIIEYKSTNKSIKENCIKSIDEIVKLSKKIKNQGKRIVFTNGCFDILHSGHVNYLESAKKFGDVLIVGLNSDSSIKEIKGENRPINSQIDRARILSALESIDYVVLFDENSPYKLIKAIEPHTLVKGGDYENKEVIGQDIVDELKIVKFVPGKSTSKTIETIRNLK